ncbi:ribonuclease domain-containing protein [Streptomyces sp. NPDC058657]|uniref:ribonuclease domain-containing protein n=1 Tax=unclassified Streptomyces TaxID=2593676 RepID=UPI0036611A22
MRIPPRIAALGAAVALSSALLAGGATAAPHAAPVASAPVSVSLAAQTASAAQLAAVGEICHSKLPKQAHHTLNLIAKGGPFPYEQDGTVFRNREGILPSQSNGYYHEYTVVTPGAPTRGAKRIVTGSAAQEDYYTADHYKSFSQVKYGC